MSQTIIFEWALARSAPLVYVSREFDLLGSKNVSLPGTTFSLGGKEIEVFTLEDKGAKIHSFEILFVDKASQQNIATYSVNNPRFKEKGFVYDVAPFFEAVVADFKRIG